MISFLEVLLGSSFFCTKFFCRSAAMQLPRGEPLPFGQYFHMAKLAKAMRKCRHEVVQLDHPDLLQFVNALVTGTRFLMFLGYSPSSLLGGNKSSRILWSGTCTKPFEWVSISSRMPSEMLKFLLHQQQTQKEILEVKTSRACMFFQETGSPVFYSCPWSCQVLRLGHPIASSSTRPGCAS